MSESQQTLSTQQALDLAVQHHAAGRLDQAESIYQQILQTDPNQPAALHLLGVMAHQKGRNDAAVDLITKALILKPELAEARNNLGNVLQGLGKLEDALDSYHKALAIRPNFADAHYNLGNTLKALGKLEEAATSYRKALEFKPDFAEAHSNLGFSLRSLGKLEEAVASYQKALNLKPDYAEGHNNLGVALQGLGKLDDAMASYYRALALKPEYPDTHNNLGNALLELGKTEEAGASYRKALDLKPNYAEAHSNLGNTLGKLGRLEEAVIHCKKAINIKPDLVEAHNNLGNVLMSSRRLEEAEKFYRFALKLKPHFATAIDNLCMALQSQGKSTEALEYCRKALELDPNNINARVSLAKSFDSLVPVWHTAMMNDKLRNNAYLAALQTAITADTHVLEIGTGSGLLAMMAARCGAKQVTTCEMSPLIAATAKEIISTNGMADSIDVIAKKSTNLEMGVDLPGRADLLVFELFSSEFLGEGVLSSIEDAKRRLLGSDGRIIPSGGNIMIALFGGDHIGKILMVDDVNGFDMKKFNSITSSKRGLSTYNYDVELLTDDVEAFSFDFYQTIITPPKQKTLRIPITKTGKCYGVLQWNRIQMDDTVIFENHPSIKTPTSSWKHFAYIFDEPIHVKPNQTAVLSAMHNRMAPWFAMDGIEED